MNEECDIVKDLIPLYTEDLTSEASSQFIKNHLDACESCKVYLERLERNLSNQEPIDMEIDENDRKLVKGIQKKMNKMIWVAILTAVLIGSFSPMMFGQGSANNSQATIVIYLISTFFIGMLSFVLVKKLWVGPVVTLLGGLISAITFSSHLSTIAWIGLYAISSLLGAFVGAGIEKIKYKKLKITFRVLIGITGVSLALISFLLFIFFTDMNPSKSEENKVIAQAEEYLETEYPDGNYEIYDVLYDNMGNYYYFEYAAKVRNLDNGDDFLVYYNDQSKQMEDSIKYPD